LKKPNKEVYFAGYCLFCCWQGVNKKISQRKGLNSTDELILITGKLVTA